MPTVEITGLFCYPIKSCAAVAAREVEIDGLGVRYDRHWMVTDGAGQFLTQREHPAMARISPAIEGEHLVVRADGAPDLHVPLHTPGRSPRTTTVWKFTGTAEDAGDAAADWFRARLERDCRLVRAGADWDRPVNPTYARPDDRVGFADGYPMLLASEASLADLNARLPDTTKAAPMDRFRPNLVVAGADLTPWAEDDWRGLRLPSGATLNAIRTCARCAVITIDQQTAERCGPEPLKTLSAFRRVEEGRVLFGVYLTADGPCCLRVGDCLMVESLT